MGRLIAYKWYYYTRDRLRASVRAALSYRAQIRGERNRRRLHWTKETCWVTGENLPSGQKIRNVICNGFARRFRNSKKYATLVRIGFHRDYRLILAAVKRYTDFPKSNGKRCIAASTYACRLNCNIARIRNIRSERGITRDYERYRL